MSKKIRCTTCKARFHVFRWNTYTVIAARNIYKWVRGADALDALEDVTDCPVCGCQVRIAERFPTFTVGEKSVFALPRVDDKVTDTFKLFRRKDELEKSDPVAWRLVT